MSKYMMTELDKLIKAAYMSNAEKDLTNKVYIELFSTRLYMPVSKAQVNFVSQQDDQPVMPLYIEQAGLIYILIFDREERLLDWAGTHLNEMSYIELSGRELIQGLNDNICLCLNYGTEYYKQFFPDELQLLKSVIAKTMPTDSDNIH